MHTPGQFRHCLFHICYVIYMGFLGYLHVFIVYYVSMHLNKLSYFNGRIVYNWTVEQCITERATLYKYIWKKKWK